MPTVYSLLFTVFPSPLAYSAYSLLCARGEVGSGAVRDFHPGVMLQEQKGVLAFDAERGGLEKRIDVLRKSVIHGA